MFNIGTIELSLLNIYKIPNKIATRTFLNTLRTLQLQPLLYVVFYCEFFKSIIIKISR